MNDDELPLSSSQADIWYAQQLMPDVPFAIAYYVDLHGPIDVGALLDSGLKAHAEYSSVSMRISDSDGLPTQTYTDKYDDAAEIVDLRGEADGSMRARTWMEQDCRSPLPLNGSLVRLRLFRLSDDHVLWYTRAHHIALDGYAAVQVLERAASIYNAVVAGEEPESVVVTTPAVVVHEDREYQASKRATRDRAYWISAAQRSASITASLGRAAVPQPRSTTVGCGVDANVRGLGDRFSPGEQATSSVVIAAFAAFLARMTYSEDARLSLPVSARTTALLRRAGSSMSNVVPLVLPGIGRTTVAGAVKLTETSVGGVLRHQRSRPSSVQAGASGWSSSTGTFGPAVNIMMFTNKIAVGDVEGQVRILTTGPVTDLAVDVYPDRAGDGPRIDFEANPAAYTPQDLLRYHRRFLHFLTQFSDPSGGDNAVADLDLFLPDERHTSAASTGAVSAARSTLIEVFDRAVRQHGDRIAVESGDVVLTYRELDEKVDLVAHVLIERGIGPEDSVAVHLSRSIESVVAFWAVARAGAVYVPIDPKLPADRVRFMLRDCRAVLGLRAGKVDDASAGGTQWLDTDRLLDVDWASHGWSADTTRESPLRRVSVSNAAYVIYTSGSTGVPKGVVVAHGGFGGLVQHIRASYGLDETSRVCHLASPGFDTAVVEHLASAVAGACLVIAPPDTYAGPELTGLIARRRLTHLLITPSVLATLTTSDLTEVATVVIGGESASDALVCSWSRGRRLINAYGPTETTCSVTMTEPLDAADALGIGTAMAGATIFLLDRALEPVPPGAIGEIYIATAGIARGYLDRPAETATRFVANPFGQNGSRLFRSGDLARCKANGTLEFLGRTDDQVKIRGNRVELGEIDAALAAHPLVVSAAAAIRRNRRGEPRIDGYVACGANEPVDPRELRKFLTMTLPAHAVPSTITVLESIPLTVNRKIDRHSLPEPSFEVNADAVEGPRGQTEITVAQLYSDILATEDVDVNTSFFDLGGDSLAATRVVARLRRDLGVDLGIADLVHTGSVRSLADVIDARDARAESRPDRPTRGAADEVSVIPLAPQQEGIDRAALLPLYNLPFTVEITGPFDVAAAAAAFGDVVRRHRSLRTVYPDSAFGPHQEVRDRIVELRSTRASWPLDTGAVDEVLFAPFDVRSELPIRAMLFEMSAEHHVFACCVHHIAADGWSLGLLARDFLTAYVARSAGETPIWTGLPLHYADFSVWASARNSDASDLDFWRRELRDLRLDPAVVTDRPRPSTWDFAGGRVEFDIDVDTVDGLDLAAHRYHTGRFTVLRSALIVLLADLTDERDIVIGTPVAGRDDPVLEHVVGTFANTLVIRSDISEATTFGDVLDIARSSEIRAFDHASVPFGEVVAELDPGPYDGRHPLFQVALSLDVFTSSRLGIGDTYFAVTPRPLDTAKCDLHFHVVEREKSLGDGGGISVGIVYPTSLFDRGTIESIAESYTMILRRMAADPKQSWSSHARVSSTGRPNGAAN